MVFGDMDQFAIELEMDKDHGGTWMFGRVCYWLCWQRIGDYDLGTSLRDVLFNWERISCDAGSRANEGLIALDKEDLARLLSTTLFGDAEVDAAVESRSVEEQWARHDINPDVDVFNEWHIYLIENDSMARCIYVHIPTDEYHECRLEYGQFDKVLRAALQTLRQYYEIEYIKDAEHGKLARSASDV